MDTATAPNPTGAIRLLTLNILGVHADWPRRREALRSGMRALRPDLLTLQETIVRPGFDQVRDILGDEYHVVHSAERHSDGMGTSIASRWPITSVDNLDFHVTDRTRGFPCSALLAEVDVPAPVGNTLLVNHFPDYQPSHERERELQTLIVARHIEARVAAEPMHVVLAGDLDAEPDAASLRFLAGRQSLGDMSVCYRSAWEAQHPGQPALTFTERNPLMAKPTRGWPFQAIDHIFVRCGDDGWPTLRIDSCQVAFEKPVAGAWASDHFGLVADLAPLVE